MRLLVYNHAKISITLDKSRPAKLQLGRVYVFLMLKWFDAFLHEILNSTKKN